MSWREQLSRVRIGTREYIGGSFRGAPFFVDASDRSGGRRTEIHEYPGQNLPFAEDLGRKPREFSITAYVVGSGYLAARDAVIEAAESDDGAGELVHPFFGRLQCVCTEYSVSESRDEGGIARISLSFVETLEAPPFPLPAVDVGSSLNLAADAALLVLQAQFVAAYDPTTVIGSYLAPMSDLLSGFSAGLNRPGSSLIREAQALAEFRWQINRTISRAAEYVLSPAATWDAISGLLGQAFAPPTVPESILGFLSLMDISWASLPPVTGTPSQSRQTQSALFFTLAQTVRAATLITASKLAGEASFPVFSEARTVRDALLFRYDEIMGEGIPDDLFALFQDLRAGVLAALPDPDEQTRDVVALTMARTEQSITLAHRLYGDTSRELDICARNAIEYPGVIPAGSALEVVTGV